MALEHPNITLGTAGHIDHGKTALVKFLTGCDTDRLPAEKERGMSIDLGFAPCTIGGMQVGIVDVPGHEDFIKTMVAGASAMDGVIFVVAADDGVMPQTREHLEILTLLGVRYGLVALTKIDRVDSGGLELVREEVAEFLRGTFLEGAPILGMCNLTGDGFTEFYTALADLVGSISPRSTEGVFRLPVERAFSIAGYGTVVAGVPVSGSARVGDEVVLLPHGVAGRIRRIEVYGRQADAVIAGQCAGLNVKQWDSKAVQRGNTVASPGYFEAGQWFACTLELLPRPGLLLKTGQRVRFHTGTSEVVASLYFMEGNRLGEGGRCLAQVRTAEPLVAGPRDRFIVRSLSPAHTIGGGTIIECIPGRLRRNRPGLLEDLRRRAEAVQADADFVEYCVRDAGLQGVGPGDLAIRAKLPRRALEGFLGALAREGKIIALGEDLCLHAESAAEAAKLVSHAVAAHHETMPQSPGIALDGLREGTGLASAVQEYVVRTLTGQGKLSLQDGRLALPGHRVAFSPEEQGHLEALESAFCAAGLSPPRPAEAVERSGLPRDRAEWALRVLKESGRLVEVGEDLLFHRDAVDRARQILVDFIRREGKLESVKFKYLLDTTRKFAIPLLDYFDRIGVTSRVGHTRYLRGQ